MKTYYPVGVDLEDKNVLLVGGGTIADGKLDALLECGARVRLVSPEVTPRIVALAAAGGLAWVRRAFKEGDVRDAWIVIAATDDRAVNAQVAAAARAAGRLVNAVDDVPYCDFIAMSVLRRGNLQVAVSTGGGSPAMARWVREGLEPLVPDAFGPLLELLAEIRADLKARGRIPPYATWRDAITPTLLEHLAAGRRDEARRLLSTALAPPSTVDHSGGYPAASAPPSSPLPLVSLVGAGPGDPDLISVRGRDRLARADVVVYDHLVDERVLALARPDAELIYAGKEPGRHYVPQEQTNALLIDLARRNLNVVRLKGGDPFVFGRGGEEAAALAAAGITFEIVPGISSAVAVPAYAGIPVTHRGRASALVVVTGHESPDKPDSAVAWDELARSGATIVVLMGMSNLPAIVDRLLAAGRPRTTPVAVVQNGTRPDQRTVTATLSDVVQRVAQARLGSPAVIVVGEVVGLREQLRWFDAEPTSPAAPRPILRETDKELLEVTA